MCEIDLEHSKYVLAEDIAKDINKEIKEKSYTGIFGNKYFKFKSVQLFENRFFCTKPETYSMVHYDPNVVGLRETNISKHCLL